MKQKKKKIPNRVSGTNGDEKTSEKPVLDEAPPSAEAQVREGFLWVLACLRVWSRCVFNALEGMGLGSAGS